mmetsp:Transcript_5060/g.11245  ORF Transcript_5060/g.11245 Transcript_5060/m.11245 type:complete len:126 (-) Transcript_5060:613-990(-)
MKRALDALLELVRSQTNPELCDPTYQKQPLPFLHLFQAPMRAEMVQLEHVLDGLAARGSSQHKDLRGHSGRERLHQFQAGRLDVAWRHVDSPEKDKWDVGAAGVAVGGTVAVAEWVAGSYAHAVD